MIKPEAHEDLPQIATWACRLNEPQGHRDGRSVEDWNAAEQETREAGKEYSNRAASSAGSKRETLAGPNAVKAETKLAQPEAKPGAAARPPPHSTTELVERVHRLHEKSGREVVRAVDAFQKAEAARWHDEPRP